MLRKNVMRCIAGMAELAQNMMGHQLHVHVADDGRVSHMRTGLSGRILDQVYEERMNELKAQFSATPMGGAILSFLDEQGIAVSFDHRFDKDVFGAANGNRTIRLRANAPMDALVGTLAHEARHHMQFIALDAFKYPLPPRAQMARMLMMEADAFSFEQKFAEDYAARTGNDGPLKAMTWFDGTTTARNNIDDNTRFLEWLDIMKVSGDYTSGAFYKMGSLYAEMQGDMSNERKAALRSAREDAGLIADMADAFRLSLVGRNFTSDAAQSAPLPAQDIIQKFSYDADREKTLTDITQKYEEAYSAIKSASHGLQAPQVKQSNVSKFRV